MPNETPSTFLSGMRAEGKRYIHPETRKEYEAGFMAVRDIIQGVEEIDTMLQRRTDAGRSAVARLVADVDATWSRVKAAIAGEVVT